MAMYVSHYLERLQRGEPVPDGVGAGYPFTHVGARMREADVLAANLECVVSPKGWKATDHSPLRAPLSTIRLIKEAGIDVVTIANNHTGDFGEEAFDDMARRLTAEGMPFIGGRSFVSGPEEPFITEVRGLKIGFLGFYLRTLEGQVADVQRARPSVDVLVVFYHWGREGQSEPLGLQRRQGRAVIDAGADLVVGTHAHVVSPEEWYKGKLVFYGLGNFVFSGMNIDDAHRTGGYLEVDVGPKGLTSRRFYRARLDDTYAPRWLDQEPSEPPRVADSEAPPL